MSRGSPEPYTVTQQIAGVPASLYNLTISVPDPFATFLTLQSFIKSVLFHMFRVFVDVTTPDKYEYKES